MGQITLDNKLEAEQAYLNAKKTIAEIKETQNNISKLLNEIKELSVKGFTPHLRDQDVLLPKCANEEEQ